MALEQYFEEAMAQNNFNGDRKSCLEKWQSDDTPSGGFDCNICLDSVQDPVVTLCGHLFCWPCIYKWLHFQSVSAENQDPEQMQCPVCKAEVSQASLVPLYGRGHTTKPSKGKAPNLGIVIPRRPLGPVCDIGTPRSPSTATNSRGAQQLHNQRYPQQSQRHYHHLESFTTSSMLSGDGTTTNVSHPIIGMFGEMIYARVFGNSVTNLYTYPNSYHLAGTNSPRVRRHVMQTDKSLSRICFFLLCCVMLCLALF